jgi:hypothetical protein
MGQYTILILTAFSLLGIALHNLVKLDSLNRANNGTVNLVRYWKLERFSILISMCLMSVAIFARVEIMQATTFSKWVGLGFTTCAYMAQSIVIAVGGRTQKYLDKIHNSTSEKDLTDKNEQ